MRTLKDILNKGTLQLLTPAFTKAKLGTLLGLVPTSAVVVVASNIGVLPATAKARAILRAFSTAGTLTGYLTPTNLATPTTGLIGINQNGDLLFAAADAVTEVEVTYLTHEGEIREEVITVASNSGTLLNSRRAVVLLSATSLAGTLTGALTNVARAATPTTGQAALGVTGKTVTFAAADAVTSALVKYIEYPTLGLSGALNTADTPF